MNRLPFTKRQARTRVAGFGSLGTSDGIHLDTIDGPSAGYDPGAFPLIRGNVVAHGAEPKA